MKNIEKALRDQGVNSKIFTNGYLYNFNYKGLKVKFCVQFGFNGNGKFVGHMYDEKLLPKEVIEMEREFKEEGLTNPLYYEKLKENVRKYNYKDISITGYLDNLIPELFELINMNTEDYLSQKLNDEKRFDEVITEV
jgi:hypothetical protein